VFVEKPLTQCVADAQIVVDLARSHGAHLAVGYQLLACPSVQRFSKDWTHLHIWDRQNMARWPRASYARDLLLDFSHEVSLALFWAGSAPSQANIDWVNPARCAMQLEWNDGRTAQIELASDFIGYERGALSDRDSWTFDGEENDEAYRTELKEFLAGTPICTADHGLSVMQILERVCNYE
jgi:predicted dehydrogenase